MELDKYLSEDLELLDSPSCHYPDPWQPEKSEARPTEITNRTTDIRPINSTIGIIEMPNDPNLWRVNPPATSSEIINDKFLEVSNEKSPWINDVFNDSSSSYSNVTPSYVSPMGVDSVTDNGIFVKPEPLDNRLSIWEDVTNSVQHVNASNISGSISPYNIPCSDYDPQLQCNQASLDPITQSSYEAASFCNKKLYSQTYTAVVTSYNPSVSDDGIKLEVSPSYHSMLSSNRNMMTSSCSNSRQSYTTFNDKTSNTIAGSNNFIPKTYTLTPPPSNSPGNINCQTSARQSLGPSPYPNSPSSGRRTPPPPYTAVSNVRSHQALSTLTTSTSNMRPIIGAGNNSPNLNFIPQISPQGSSNTKIYPKNTACSPSSFSPEASSSQLAHRSSSSSSRPPICLPSSMVAKYSRRNNPELEKRRIHYCDFPGEFNLKKKNCITLPHVMSSKDLMIMYTIM